MLAYHHLSTIFKTLFLTVLLFSGQAALASPHADASYIAQRNLDPATMETVQRQLKSSFAAVYSRPIVGLGIEIIDGDRFIDLIPHEDIAPYVDRYLSQTIKNFLSIYTPEQLASMVTILRSDEDASFQEIFSEESRQKYAVALEQARAKAQPSGSVDPTVNALEEMSVQLNATVAMLDGNGAKAIGQNIAASIAPLFTLVSYGHEIQRLRRDLDNPVTIAALRADGVLRFANPVQRQTLLRQLSSAEETGGIRFLRPPSYNVGSN